MPVVNAQMKSDSKIHSPVEEHHVLMADDSQNDHLLMLMAAEEAGISINFEFVDDGAQLLCQLSKARSISALPDLIVLDLRMPHVDGTRSLEILKSDPIYAEIPVVILTTSSSDHDRKICMELGADAFWTKPSSFFSTGELVREIRDFASGRSGYRDVLRSRGADHELAGREPADFGGDEPLVFEIDDMWTM